MAFALQLISKELAHGETYRTIMPNLKSIVDAMTGTGGTIYTDQDIQLAILGRVVPLFVKTVRRLTSGCL